MKKISFLIWSAFFCIVGGTEAQNPVTWTYSATKLEPGLFEVHLMATIQSGWHVYAQEQPEDAIAVPTSIKFKNNPILIFTQGKGVYLKELGNKQHYKDADLGIEAYQYAEKVEFVKQIKFKQNLKSKKSSTKLIGTISFQACTDEKCLPPATTDFEISIEN